LVAIVLVAPWMLGLAAPALSQNAPAQPGVGLQEQGPPQASPQRENEPAPSAAKENPGLINEMGKLFDKIVPDLKGPSETIHDLNARARDSVEHAVEDAGSALSRLTGPGSMASGRVICPNATDGTPDCKLGADKLCQSKGFKQGKSLTTDSVQSCSAKTLIPGRARKPGDCRTDNYVTAALCE
jgi:hypothetical protein